MAGVLEAMVGPWGAKFISAGLIVSVLGAYLAWALICAEVMFAAGKSKDMPAVFARVNKNNVPVVALWVTSTIIQLIVISTYWSNDAFALIPIELPYDTEGIAYSNATTSVDARAKSQQPPAPHTARDCAEMPAGVLL